ncbi:acyltransferase [Schleiferiaceae bacterium]|nr:acyltransferase [Schleiferiaceae bacterium]
MKQLVFDVFRIIGFGLNLLPLSIRKILLEIFRSFPGVIGVLLRFALLTSISKKIGRKVVIFSNVVLKYPENLSLGNNVSIHEFSYIDSYLPVSIGDNVAISHKVSIIPFDHKFSLDSETIKDSGPIGSPIKVGSDCWLGAGSMLLRGAECSSRTVLAAGSILRERTRPNSLYVGIPARFKKKI